MARDKYSLYGLSSSLRLGGWRVPQPMRVFARGASLRRRVAYSLAIVRLILVPVIFLAIYYLYAMSRIVDRIVNVDAQVATLAESVSIQMLNARRMELNYFLLHDVEDLAASHQVLDHVTNTLRQCLALEPGEQDTILQIQTQLQIYRQRLDEAVTHLSQPGQSSQEHLQEVVRAYERNLNQTLVRARRESRAHLLEELRNQVGSFDIQVATTIAAGNPALRKATLGLQSSSNRILRLSSRLEQESWDHVRRDHQHARQLVKRAEIVLIIVSSLTLILSVLVSFILPRQVVKPLVDLKAAVDHAAAGNYEIEFDVEGEGEVVQLANSVRRLIAQFREKKESATVRNP
jgi:nitrogen fixation/metabolism regulation signal transduction histidine kinase